MLCSVIVWWNYHAHLSQPCYTPHYHWCLYAIPLLPYVLFLIILLVVVVTCVPLMVLLPIVVIILLHIHTWCDWWLFKFAFVDSDACVWCHLLYILLFWLYWFLVVLIVPIIIVPQFHAHVPVTIAHALLCDTMTTTIDSGDDDICLTLVVVIVICYSPHTSPLFPHLLTICLYYHSLIFFLYRLCLMILYSLIIPCLLLYIIIILCGMWKMSMWQ